MPIVSAESRIVRRRDRRALWVVPAVGLLFCALLAIPLFREVELTLGPRRVKASCFKLVWDDRVNPMWRHGLHRLPDEYMQHPRDTRAIYLRVGDWVYFTFWSGRAAAREPARPRSRDG